MSASPKVDRIDVHADGQPVTVNYYNWPQGWAALSLGFHLGIGLITAIAVWFGLTKLFVWAWGALP